MYYLRSRPAADAIKFTVDVEKLLNSSGFSSKNPAPFVNDENLDPNIDETCVACSG